MPFRLIVPASIYQAVVEQALAEKPNECCGLMAGTVIDGLGRVERHYPLVNERASPREYSADPKALFQVDKDIRQRGLEWLAVYHSHPTSEAIPSRTDYERWFLGEEVMCLIVSLVGAEPRLRAWWMHEQAHIEAEWEIEE